MEPLSCELLPGCAGFLFRIVESRGPRALHSNDKSAPDPKGPSTQLEGTYPKP